MKTKTLPLCALFLACGAVQAQDSLLNSAVQTLESGQSSQQAAPSGVAETLIKDAAMQKLKQATPAELQQGIDAVNQLKGRVNAAPQSGTDAINAVKSAAEQKAAEKALNLLQ
ncbi:MAG: hypothetical protein PHW13_02705 [Methylococcales bacterium]|nr:hypothetical protein [Methylococcales bacterium]